MAMAVRNPAKNNGAEYLSHRTAKELSNSNFCVEKGQDANYLQNRTAGYPRGPASSTSASPGHLLPEVGLSPGKIHEQEKLREPVLR